MNDQQAFEDCFRGQRTLPEATNASLQRAGAPAGSHQPEAHAGSDSHGTEEPARQDPALEPEDAFKRPVQRRQIEQTVSPGTKAVPPPYVGQRFQSAQAMETFFSAWGRAQKVWLIGTQHTLSATYTCEACCDSANKQTSSGEPADICRAHVAARSNGKWIVDALNVQHCCGAGSVAALSVPKRSPPKRRKTRRVVESFPEADIVHERQQQQQQSTAVDAPPPNTSLTPSQLQAMLDSELAVPTSAAESSPTLASTTTGNRVPVAPAAPTTQVTHTTTASSASAELVTGSNATSLAHSVAPPPPPSTTTSTRTTTPRTSKIGGFLVTKPAFSEKSATKIRNAAEATLLQDEIAAFLLSLVTAQNAEACSRAAKYLASAGVKTAGDLATIGYFEPATRQAFLRALRLQGADDATLDALSYVISKEVECFHHA